jgi:hypothetical protein
MLQTSSVYGKQFLRMQSKEGGRLPAHLDALRIDLTPGGVDTDFLFWAALQIQELGYFPVGRMMRMRAWQTLWRRRSEIAGLLGSLAGKPQTPGCRSAM